MMPQLVPSHVAWPFAGGAGQTLHVGSHEETAELSQARLSTATSVMPLSDQAASVVTSSAAASPTGTSADAISCGRSAFPTSS
jgi:hypothetical protein